MLDERLAPNFYLSEFLHSDTAERRRLDNTPLPTELANIRNLLAPGMQRVREVLMRPIYITSGYRSPDVNRAVNGAPNSQHTQGLAADFKCPTLGMPLAIARHLMEDAARVSWDQLIVEGTWVHVSFAPSPRGQVLTAHFGPDGTTYTEGL